MKIIRAVNSWMESFCQWVTQWTGSTVAFVLSVFLIIVWLSTGPIYKYSDTWQLVANTFTTLIEFIMVFVLQNAQNKDTREMHGVIKEILARLDAKDKNQVES